MTGRAGRVAGRAVRPSRIARGIGWSILAIGCTLAHPAGAEDRYDLAPGDRISITMFDQPDISGSYLVEPTGAITLPLIGAVRAAELTPQELRAELVKRFGDGYFKNPAINVRLTDLRPVTIVGDLRAPGRFTYVDGMTVQTGLGLAGGSERLTTEETTQRLDMLRSQERLAALTLAQVSQGIRKDRLEAQIKGAPSFEASVKDPQRPDLVASLVSSERQTMVFEQAAQADQITLLNQQIATLEADIASYTEQAALENKQIQIIDSELTDVNGLLANGWTRKSPVQDLQRERARTQADLLRVTGDGSRAKAAIAEAKMKLRAAGPTYVNRLATELQAVTLQLQDGRSSIALTRQDLQTRADLLPLEPSQDRAPPVLRLSRYRNGKVETSEATLDMPLRPGDILQVGREAGGGLGAPVGASGGRLPEPDSHPAVGTVGAAM